ncbi:GAF domain-containing protein [Streptomyces sp. NPDC050504]|uniref:GAF domain-containing protein n=1 Tax=Streptomyces sp. NPDC050504 TaxID=3365618 RepID=UPI0037B4920B
MSEAWVALEAGADPVRRCGELLRAHEAFTASGRVERPVRPVVAASWRRSARALVCPDGTAQVELDEDDIGRYRDEHPLARVMPVIRELTAPYAMDGRHLLAVCDARARLLWVEGHPETLRRAGRMNFVAGARWSESAAGTNAPGTAVAVDRPVQVFAAEHFRRPVQAWTCAAAPVHDPGTGRLIGAVDITGGDPLAHPHSLAFVQAVARAAESQLALLAPRPDVGGVRLHALGGDEALLLCEGRKVRLSRRHSEIVVLLAHRPDGLGGDELLSELYEDEAAHPVTLRAELSRLRALLGPELLRSRPYRFTVPVDADFATVTRRLASGAVAAAAGAYAGPLLPASRAPGVVRLRRRVEEQLRAAVIARGDPGLLGDWAHSPWGEDDLPVWRALAAVAGAGQRAPALARVRELDAELSAGWGGSEGSGAAVRVRRAATVSQRPRH